MASYERSVGVDGERGEIHTRKHSSGTIHTSVGQSQFYSKSGENPSSEPGIQSRRLPSGTLQTNVGQSHFYNKVGIVPIFDSPDSSSGLRSMSASLKLKHLSGGHDFTTRFPKLEDCAHFHYDFVELGAIQVVLDAHEDSYRSSTLPACQTVFNLKVLSNNKTWTIKRHYENFRFLDKQLHKCIYDRKFSQLTELKKFSPEKDCSVEEIHIIIMTYLARFSVIAGERINCGPVLNWLEMDNRGNRLLVTDESDINTPAIAAAHVVKRYQSQATDEMSLEVGDIISVIYMAPTEDTHWWRGKNNKFEVGYFPMDCVEVIGDKIPRSMEHKIHDTPKPVLRKRGKLITFLGRFFNTRPTRSTLKQSGIMKERVFGCDLGEHLLNSEHEVPKVLNMCSTIIEEYGLVDGIYRLSGVASNIQKLRLAFDEDNPPDLADEQYVRQDIHSISSLLKMYFRELPNPLLTYELYDSFAEAVKKEAGRAKNIYNVVQQLPPPHYRTARYLFTHLNTVAAKGKETGMHHKNLAIVWAPNLMRSKDLEQGGGTAVLKGVGIQAVVTECLIKYSKLIFSDKSPSFGDETASSPRKSRPKSLAVSTPSKLLSLEEAKEIKALSCNILSPVKPTYIEVGAGPQNVPRYHAVIDLPSNRKRMSKTKKSPGWKSFFSKDKSKKHRKISMPNPIRLGSENTARKLWSVKSADSLLNRHSIHLDNITIRNPYTDEEESVRAFDDTAVPSMSPIRTELKRSNSLESYFENPAEEETPTCTPTPTGAVSFFCDDTYGSDTSRDTTRTDNMMLETSFVGPDSPEPNITRTPTIKSKIAHALSPRSRRKKSSSSPSYERSSKSPRLSTECETSEGSRSDSHRSGKTKSKNNPVPYVDTKHQMSVSTEIIPVALVGSPGAKKKLVRKFSGYESEGTDEDLNATEVFSSESCDSGDLLEDCFRELKSRSVSDDSQIETTKQGRKSQYVDVVVVPSSDSDVVKRPEKMSSNGAANRKSRMADIFKYADKDSVWADLNNFEDSFSTLPRSTLGRHGSLPQIDKISETDDDDAKSWYYGDTLRRRLSHSLEDVYDDSTLTKDTVMDFESLSPNDVMSSDEASGTINRDSSIESFSTVGVSQSTSFNYYNEIQNNPENAGNNIISEVSNKLDSVLAENDKNIEMLPVSPVKMVQPRQDDVVVMRRAIVRTESGRMIVDKGNKTFVNIGMKPSAKNALPRQKTKPPRSDDPECCAYVPKPKNTTLVPVDIPTNIVHPSSTSVKAVDEINKHSANVQPLMSTDSSGTENSKSASEKLLTNKTPYVSKDVDRLPYQFAHFANIGPPSQCQIKRTGSKKIVVPSAKVTGRKKSSDSVESDKDSDSLNRKKVESTNSTLETTMDMSNVKETTSDIHTKTEEIPKSQELSKKEVTYHTVEPVKQKADSNQADDIKINPLIGRKVIKLPGTVANKHSAIFDDSSMNGKERKTYESSLSKPIVILPGTVDNRKSDLCDFSSINRENVNNEQESIDITEQGTISIVNKNNTVFDSRDVNDTKSDPVVPKQMTTVVDPVSHTENTTSQPKDKFVKPSIPKEMAKLPGTVKNSNSGIFGDPSEISEGKTFPFSIFMESSSPIKKDEIDTPEKNEPFHADPSIPPSVANEVSETLTSKINLEDESTPHTSLVHTTEADAFSFVKHCSNPLTHLDSDSTNLLPPGGSERASPSPDHRELGDTVQHALSVTKASSERVSPILDIIDSYSRNKEPVYATLEETVTESAEHPTEVRRRSGRSTAKFSDLKWDPNEMTVTRNSLSPDHEVPIIDTSLQTVENVNTDKTAQLTHYQHSDTEKSYSDRSLSPNSKLIIEKRKYLPKTGGYVMKDIEVVDISKANCDDNKHNTKTTVIDEPFGSQESETKQIHKDGNVTGRKKPTRKNSIKDLRNKFETMSECRTSPPSLKTSNSCQHGDSVSHASSPALNTLKEDSSRNTQLTIQLCDKSNEISSHKTPPIPSPRPSLTKRSISMPHPLSEHIQKEERDTSEVKTYRETAFTSKLDFKPRTRGNILNKFPQFGGTPKSKSSDKDMVIVESSDSENTGRIAAPYMQLKTTA